MTFFRQIFSYRVRIFQRNFFDRQLIGKLAHELVDDHGHDLTVEGVEGDDAVQTVSELGTEYFFNGFFALADGIPFGITEADGGAAHLTRPGIGCHHDDHIAKIGLLAVIVRQGGMIQNLQQDVEQVFVGFFNFIQQQNTVRVFADTVGEQAALVEADVSGGRANQTGHGMFFHVLAHVITHKFHIQLPGHLSGHFGLADTGGTRKKK